MLRGNLERNRVKTYSGIPNISLRFDKNAFSLLNLPHDSITKNKVIEDITETLCQQITAEQRKFDTNKTAKSYYIHCVYIEGETIYFVYGDLFTSDRYAAKSHQVINKKLTAAEKNEFSTKTEFVECIPLAPEDHSSAKTEIEKLKAKAKQNFIEGKVQPFSPPTQEQLIANTQDKINAEIDLLLGSQHATEELNTHAENNIAILNRQLNLIRETELFLKQQADDYLATILYDKEPQANFYEEQIKDTFALLTEKKAKICRQKEELNLKPTTLGLTLNANYKAIKNKLDDILYEKISLLRALYQTAFDIFQAGLAQSKDKAEFIKRFNQVFKDVANANEFGHLAYEGEGFLVRDPYDLEKLANSLIKTLKKKERKNLIANLKIFLNRTTVYCFEEGFASDGISINKRLLEEFNHTVQECKKALLTKKQALMSQSYSDTQLPSYCDAIKQQNSLIITSLPLYSEFRRFQMIGRELENFLKSQVNTLKEFSITLLTWIEKLASEKPEDPQISEMRDLNEAIKTEVLNMETLLKNSAQLSSENKIDPTLTYLNISDNCKKQRLLLDFYKANFSPIASDLPFEAEIKKLCRNKLNELSQKMVKYHPEYQQYKLLLAKAQIIKKKAQELIDSKSDEENCVEAAKKIKDKATDLLNSDSLKAVINEAATDAEQKYANFLAFCKEATPWIGVLHRPEDEANLSYENLAIARNGLSQTIATLNDTVSKIEKNKTEMASTLLVQNKAFKILLSRTINVSIFTQAIVDIVLDNTFWAAQVSGGKPSPYDASVKVPTCIAQMQTQIKNNGWISEGEPEQAKILLELLKNSAKTRVERSGFFERTARNKVSAKLYDYLQNMSYESLLINTDIHLTIAKMKLSIGYAPSVKPTQNLRP